MFENIVGHIGWSLRDHLTLWKTLAENNSRPIKCQALVVEYLNVKVGRFSETDIWSEPRFWQICKAETRLLDYDCFLVLMRQ